MIFFPIHGSRIIEQDSCGLCRRCRRDDAVGIAALKGDKHQLPLGLLQRIRKQQHLRNQSVPESHSLWHILILRIAQKLPHIKARIVPADRVPLEANFMAVFCTGYRQDRVKGTRHAQGTGGDRAGFHHIAAPVAVISRGSVIASGDHHIDAGRVSGIIYLCHPFVVHRATGRAQGEVGAVHTQKDGVFHGRHQIIQIAVAVVVKDLHHHQLRLRGNAHGVHLELFLGLIHQIAGYNSGHVGAVAKHGLVIGAKIGLPIAIVVAIGNLAAVIHLICRQPFRQGLCMQHIGGQNVPNGSFVQGNQALILGLNGKGRVLEAQACVDDGYAHTLSRVPQVPGSSCPHEGGGVLQIGRNPTAYRCCMNLGNGIAGHQECLFHTIHSVDSRQICVLHGGRNGVGQKCEVLGNLNVVSQLPANGLRHHLLLLFHSLHGVAFRRSQFLAQMYLHGVHLTDGVCLKGNHHSDHSRRRIGFRQEAELLTIFYLDAA